MPHDLETLWLVADGAARSGDPAPVSERRRSRTGLLARPGPSHRGVRVRAGDPTPPAVVDLLVAASPAHAVCRHGGPRVHPEPVRRRARRRPAVAVADDVRGDRRTRRPGPAASGPRTAHVAVPHPRLCWARTDVTPAPTARMEVRVRPRRRAAATVCRSGDVSDPPGLGGAGLRLHDIGDDEQRVLVELDGRLGHARRGEPGPRRDPRPARCRLGVADRPGLLAGCARAPGAGRHTGGWGVPRANTSPRDEPADVTRPRRRHDHRAVCRRALDGAPRSPAPARPAPTCARAASRIVPVGAARRRLAGRGGRRGGRPAALAYRLLAAPGRAAGRQLLPLSARAR